MTKPVKVFEDREMPGEWRVERFDNDGACDLVEIFAGPFARRRALRCAMQKYGHFKEVAATARSLLEVIGDHRNVSGALIPVLAGRTVSLGRR